MQREMQRTTTIVRAEEGTVDERRPPLKRRIIRWTRPVDATGTWRASGCVEAVLGVAIVSAAGAIIPGHWGLLTLYPHPLWIVVLGIAIRYGAPSGYIAGALAAISQCTALWLRPDARFGAIHEHALIQPFLFIVVGMLVGHAVRAQRQRLTNTETKHREATEALQTLSEEHAATRAVKVELEKQIVGQPDSIATLYEVAKHLETLEEDALYPAILGLIQRFTAAEACAYYRVEDGMVRRAASLPERPASAASGREVPHWLLAEAIAERRTVTVRDRLLAFGANALGREAVLVAGPLLDRDGTVIGVVAIERLPFLKLTQTTIRLFGLILDWGSTALQNATLYARSRAERMTDEETGAYSGSHMLRLARQETERSERYRLPLAVVVLHIDAFETVPVAARVALSRTVIDTARRDLRAVDLIGHHPMPGMFTLILPMTDAYAVQVVVARIDDNLRDADLRPYGDDRPLVMNYGFLTHLRTAQDTGEMIRNVFAEDGGARFDDEPAFHIPRPLALLMPETIDDLDERMVGD